MPELLIGQIQPYAWGSESMIPELLGVPPTGKPQAELWLGAHPGGPTQLGTPTAVGRRTLADALAVNPTGLIGEQSVQTFGPRLPYLLKVLAAAQPLSLQAHPSRAQAETGFAYEEGLRIPRDAPHRLYKDDWPKPELLCALVRSEALCGFAHPDEVYGHFASLGVRSVLDLVAPLADTERDEADRIREVFATLLRLPLGQRFVVDEVAGAAQTASSDNPGTTKFLDTAVELAEYYPSDPGVLAALLMNRVTLEVNEAIFLPAGNLHAYLNGGGIEIMANSDNVMRGGLTLKHVDVDSLLAVLDFTPGFPGFTAPVDETPADSPGQVLRYDTPAPEFALWRLELSSELALPGAGMGRVVIVTSGQATLTSEQGSLPLRRGQSAFIGAAEQATLTGTGRVFLAGPGLR